MTGSMLDSSQSSRDADQLCHRSTGRTPSRGTVSEWRIRIVAMVRNCAGRAAVWNKVAAASGFILLGLMLIAYGGCDCLAQFVSPGIARWSVANQVYRGHWYGPVQYGASGYSYYPNGAQTAYGNAVRAQAALTIAQGRAAENAAKANVYNEQARQQYIENKARYEELRRQQREVIETRKAQESVERQERASQRKPKSPTELYARLPIDQLDRTSGQVAWPTALQRSEFDSDRQQIESSLQAMAQHGPDQRSAGIIHETADQMKSAVNKLMGEIGFEAYSDTRKFLSSLSVEGYYAIEEQ